MEATCKAVSLPKECAGAWAGFLSPELCFETGVKGLTWQIWVTLAADLKFVSCHDLSGTNSVFVKMKTASLNLH